MRLRRAKPKSAGRRTLPPRHVKRNAHEFSPQNPRRRDRGSRLRRGLVAFAGAAAADDLKIALIYGLTGPLQAYAKQTETGLRLGLEYATKGSMEVDGRKIVVITKDDQGKPDLAKSALAEAYEDDGVDIAVGTTSSAAAIAMLPVAEEHKKILVVEPAVADQITGDKWNRYIFRTARNSSQDAISNALAIGKPGEHIATLAQDYAFGRDGVAAFKEALAKTGATARRRGIRADQHDRFHRARAAAVRRAEGQARPQDHLDHLGRRRRSARQARRSRPGRYGIELSTGGNILPALAAYKRFPGLEGAAYYYYEIPKNPVNDWLVAEHQKRFNAPPDFFTAGGSPPRWRSSPQSKKPNRPIRRSSSRRWRAWSSTPPRAR